MKKLEVFSFLNQIKEAREARSKAVQDLSIAISEMMRLLIHEGLAQFMSPEQIASESGHPVKYVRELMRTMDLDPKSGRTTLSKKAAEALNTNAALMGIDPADFDLTSPLAYLPMGSVLKRQLTDARTSQVTEGDLSGVSGNKPVHMVDYHQHEIACGISGYDAPRLITADLSQITCETCAARMVRQ